MIKRNVTLVNMVQKWNNGMSYSTCFCDIFWGDFIWSITEKCLAFKDCGSASIFSSLWLPFPTNLTFAFFFLHFFFFPEPWTEKNVYSIWLSPRNEEKVPIYSLKEEETFKEKCTCLEIIDSPHTVGFSILKPFNWISRQYSRKVCEQEPC